MITDNKKKYDERKYLGAIHIHSAFSDGTGDIDIISKAAKKAGLDWIIITDHNSLEIEEGFYNDICVIKGEEISPQKADHYLALGISTVINSMEPQEYIKEVRAQNGFGFAAHPDEGTNNKGALRGNNNIPIKWTDKDIEPDGIEIWNWFSQWADNLNDKNIFTLIYSYLFKKNLVTEPNKDTLLWWDKLNIKNEKIVPAIGGVDAHALKITKYLIPVKIFEYEKMFKTITNVLIFDEPLSDDFETRKKQILEGIKNGKNIIINRDIDTNIPEINLKSGSYVKLEENPCLNIKTKKKSSIKVLHNGKELCNKLANNLRILLKETGKYRVEIKRGNKGFVYTNPFLVY